MKIYIMNFESIPETIPNNCEVVLPAFIEDFLLEGSRTTDLLLHNERKLLNHIQFVRSLSKTQKTKKGMKLLCLPSLQELHEKIENQYATFFKQKEA